MTCDKVAINGPNLNKLAPKKNHTGESGDERKKIIARTRVPLLLKEYQYMKDIYLFKVD